MKILYPGHSDDLNYFLGAIQSMFQEIEDLSFDNEDGIGWSPVMDVDRIAEKGLPWLAQFVGVILDYDQPLRQQVRAHDRWGRGTPLSMVAPANQYVPTTGKLYMSERNPDPYHLVFILADDPAGPIPSDWATVLSAYSPILWYRMNAVSGTTETDLGSLAHNGTYINNPLKNQPGLVVGSDPAVRMDATLAQRLVGADDAAYSPRNTPQFTFGFWYEFDAVPTTIQRLAGKHWPSTNNAEWTVRLGPDGVVSARIFSLNQTLLANASFGTPTLGVKHFYCFTIETNTFSGTSTLRTYLDGRLVDIQTYAWFSTGDGVAAFQVNGSYSEAYYSTGVFDEVFICATTLSAADISVLNVAGTVSVYPGAQSYEDIFEVIDSYHHILTEYSSYGQLYGSLRGNWVRVEEVILANKPAGIQIAFIETDTTLYLAIYLLDPSYATLYAFNTYQDVYVQAFPDITITPPRFQQLISARYYRNLYHQFETYQHIVNAYLTY